jgi:phage-related minor tail protein
MKPAADTNDPYGVGPIEDLTKRATGGPVSRGTSYLVGERGPELITAGRSGYVNRAGSFPAGGINVSPVFNMTFNGRTDAEDVVQQIRRVLRDEVRETFRGVYADAGLRFA